MTGHETPQEPIAEVHLRPRQIAQRHNITERTVYTMLKDGRLKAHRIGRNVYVTVESVRPVRFAGPVNSPHPWRVVLYGRVVTVEHAEAVHADVAKAPPLTREQFDLLAVLLRPQAGCSQGNLGGGDRDGAAA